MDKRPEPRFSIVVPMRDEAGNVVALAREIDAACSGLGHFEAIFVDDGSRDGTGARIAGIQAAFPWLRKVSHGQPRGQSAAIRSGVLAGRAPIVCTLDGDGQNPPAEIPRLVAALSNGSLGLVAGERIARRDRLSKRIASRLANALRRAVLRDGARDSGCGMKAFRREVFLALPCFDNMHRYLPALVRAQGLGVAFVPVDHRPRVAGRSKYGTLDRAMAGAGDLIRVWGLTRGRHPSALLREPADAARSN
ncbi:MAG TPA: glycosyltransferase family 2 protein [Thermohalobaculum sp.]|nr:glycosyltransferase family 2 protein [Thermohalobaculum sp.]